LPIDVGSRSTEWRFSTEVAPGRASPPAADGTFEPSVLEPSVGQAMNAAVPSEPLGLDLSREVVAAQLFGLEKAPSLGRFQLLNRLGAGGMGVVYAAYDPELDRPVALKLVRVSAPVGSAAIEEGRALARLSHPNVVPVFEVGYAGEHIYIVMELVLGRTLRRWASEGRRSHRDVVKAYRQAGAGLAAAHAAGLVHQDFKPDNAIMGGDGRVRVVDFGLARAAETAEDRMTTEPGRRAGTPKYMAPEQLAGRPITGAADQYGLCAALGEALTAASGSPPPRWLAAIVERGCASDPADRYPSMSALLAALERDPAVRRRRTIAAATLALLTGLVFVTGRSIGARPAVTCAQGRARIATVWGPEGREAIFQSGVGGGAYGRSVRQPLLSQTSAYELRWAAAYRGVCEARRAGVESETSNERRLACLESGRRALAALAVLVGTGSPAGREVHEAEPADLVLAARALPDPDACAEGQAVATSVAPAGEAIAAEVAELRHQLAGARIRLAAGQARDVRGEGQRLVARARELGYAPLVAEALLLEGHATMSIDERAAAVPPLTEASTLAFRVGDEALAVESWARRAWAQGTSQGGAGALQGIEIVQAVADHLAAPSFARALLYNNVGAVEVALEHSERAAPAFERAAREAQGVVGPGAAELLVVPVNEALVTRDAARRERLLGRAVAAKADLLGPDHPETLAARWLQGDYTEDSVGALEILVPTCSALQPHNRVLAKHCWAEVAFIRADLNRTVEAIAALTAAASIEVARESDVPWVLPRLHLSEGNVAASAREFTVLLQQWPLSDTAPWWNRQTRAELELGLAEARLAAGDPRDAARTLESAVRTLSEIARKVSVTSVDRRLARARAQLARASARLRVHARARG